MSGFVKRTRSVNTVNPAGGINPAVEPNVGQYGWTKYDAGNVNQLLQYVDLCKQYAQESKDAAEYVAYRFTELQDFMTFITKVYEEIKPVYENILPIYEDIKIRHTDIATRHADIIRLHGLVQVDSQSAKDAAASALVSQNTSTVSANNAKASEINAAKSAKDAADVAEELRKGQVYRGTWNIEANNSFPPKPDTNSVWDITLNEDSTEFLFAGEKWFWGDRLLYLKDDDKFSQIESGSTVISVNGKSGAVTLNADDVGAVTKHVWDATVKLGTWSTICQLNHTRSYAGKAILTVGMTRGNFVANARFLVSWGHAGHAAITQLESHGYSQIQVRVGTIVSDQCIFSILDTDYLTTPEGSEVIYQCQVDELYGAAQLFTAFTLDDGTASIQDTVTTEWKAIKIGNNKVYHQGFNPSASDLNVVSRDGDTMKGNLRAAFGRKSAIQLEDKASIVYRDGSASWFHNFSEGNVLRWAVGQGAEDQVASLSSAGEFVAGKYVATGAGTVLGMPGGYLESKPSYTRLHGNTYSFVTSPLDAHLCYNSYWDGANWEKYDSTKESGYLVINPVGLRYVVSDAGSVTPAQRYYNIYHEGRKPTPVEIGAVGLTGGNMQGRGEVHWPQSGASLQSRDNQFVSLEGGVHSIVTAGRTNADGASYIGRNFYYEDGWKKFNNTKDSGFLEVTGTGMTFFQSDAGSENLIQKHYKVYHEGFKPSAADFGGVPVHTAPRTGGDPSALLVFKTLANVGGSSSTFSFLISGGNSFGGNQVPLYKVTVNTREDSGSGIPSPVIAKVTNLEGSDVPELSFFMVRNSGYVEFWMGRPSFSSEISVVPIVVDSLTGGSFPMGVAASVPISGDFVQIPVSSVYTTTKPPVYTEVGAAPTGYGLGEDFGGQLPGDKNLDTFRFNGFRSHNRDGGDQGGPTPYGTCLDFGHISNGALYNGWAGQMYLANTGTLYTRVNNNPGSFAGSSWATVYTDHNKPTAAEIGALPLTGGQMAGSIVTPSGLKSAIDVADKASILFRDASNSLMHQSANGNTIEWGHGTSGELFMASLDTTGTFRSKNTQWAPHHIAQSANQSTWLGIESSEASNPYISYKAQGMSDVAVGMTFKPSEIVSGNTFASEKIRVGGTDGLVFGVNETLPGTSWSTGMNPTTGDFAIKKYVNGAWNSDKLVLADSGHISLNGPTTIGGSATIAGDTNTSGGLSVGGGYIKSERTTNPMTEWLATGKHAWLGYVPDEGGFVMGASNGAGGLVTPGVHMTTSANHFSGRVNVAQNQSRGWDGLGVAAFHNTQNDVSEGNLLGLVTGKYHFPGSYNLEMGLGSLHYSNSENTCHVLWANDGSSYNRVWQFFNSGALNSPEHWNIGHTGMLLGTIWGGDLATWIRSNFAPISDSKLKRNIKPSTKSALEDVSKIDFVSYDWDETNPLTKDKKSPKIGLTAQQMESIDECYSRDIETFKEDGVTVETSVKALDVTNMLALALKAIQELEAKVAQLEEKLNVQ